MHDTDHAAGMFYAVYQVALKRPRALDETQMMAICPLLFPRLSRTPQLIVLTTQIFTFLVKWFCLQLILCKK